MTNKKKTKESCGKTRDVRDKPSGKGPHCSALPGADFKLPSNWSRYNEEAPEPPKGRDFQELLSSTGGHFRYKEELATSNFLSLDCQAVSQALLTIALPQRLRLPTHIFPAEICQVYQDDASSLRRKPPEATTSLTDSLSACLKNAKKEKISVTTEQEDEGKEAQGKVNLEDWLDNILED